MFFQNLLRRFFSIMGDFLSLEDLSPIRGISFFLGNFYCSRGFLLLGNFSFLGDFVSPCWGKISPSRRISPAWDFFSLDRGIFSLLGDLLSTWGIFSHLGKFSPNWEIFSHLRNLLLLGGFSSWLGNFLPLKEFFPHLGDLLNPPPPTPTPREFLFP